MAPLPTPLPLFDTLENIKEQKCCVTTLPFAGKDFEITKRFLLQYDGSSDTFNAYRREVERLIQWSWLIQNKSVVNLSREEIESFLKFCQKPPKRWISLQQEKRFFEKNGARTPNPKWRPFLASVSKSENKKGNTPNKSEYQLSNQAFNSLFSIIGSFYNFLFLDGLIYANPVHLIRQKSKFIQKQQQARTIRRIGDEGWEVCIATAKKMAEKNASHERTLFIISAMYYLYLRISELASSDRWTPLMDHFYQDSKKNWWFKTAGKGNKMRHVAVCEEMLQVLRDYRTSLNLTELPSPNEHFPLLPKIKGRGAISNSRQIRRLVQNCFDKAIIELKKRKTKDSLLEAQTLEQATAHWLRHTGISDDINKRHRPIAHVRDDAGHSSGATTDRYNDINLQERHASAKNKRASD